MGLVNFSVKPRWDGMRTKPKRAAFRIAFAAEVFACLLVFVPASQAQEGEATTLIHAAHVFALPGEPPLGPTTIEVGNGRIVAMRAGYSAPTQGQRVVDLRHSYVLPGLIDSHVHLDMSRGDAEQDDESTLSNEDHALVAVRHAELTLQAGFTTVRNLGGHSGIRALRDAIAASRLAGPTILDAGPGITVSGGHFDANGLNEEMTRAFRETTPNVCDGADACRRLVREQLRRRADWIKVAATAGGGSVAYRPNALAGQSMTDDELAAIVDTAARLGHPVAAHATTAGGVKAALRAGVTSIEHGRYLDDEAISLFLSKKAWLVPTLSAPDEAVRLAGGGEPDSPRALRSKALLERAMSDLRLAYGRGVPIAFGTDAGVYRHGTNAREFGLMVRAGIPPAQAIRSATIVAAEMLGLSGTVGTLEPGKAADIVAVEADPLVDIDALTMISFVMRRGVVHRLQGHRQAFPAN